jgi:hypothetical protein
VQGRKRLDKLRFEAMLVTRREFHILLALTFLACVISPFIELVVSADPSIFTTGYDTESIIAVITLLCILALALAGSLAPSALNAGQRLSVASL